MKICRVIFTTCIAALLVFLQGSALAGSTSTPEGPYPALAPLLLYFRSDQCQECDPIDKIFSENTIRRRIEERYVAVCLNIDDIQGKACAEIFAVTEVPALIIADRQGNVLFRSTDVLSAEDIVLILETTPGQIVRDVTAPEETTFIDPYPIAEIQVNLRPVLSNLEIPLPSLQPCPETVPHLFTVIGAVMEDTPPRIISSVLAPEQVHSVPRAMTVAEHHVVPIQDHVQTPMIPTDVYDPEQTVAGTTQSGPPTRTAPPTRKYQYAVQLGYFSTGPNADKLIGKAGTQGFPEVRVETEEREGLVFYRVLSGTYASLREAQAHLDHVMSMGFKGAIYRW